MVAEVSSYGICVGLWCLAMQSIHFISYAPPRNSWLNIERTFKEKATRSKTCLLRIKHAIFVYMYSMYVYYITEGSIAP